MNKLRRLRSLSPEMAETLRLAGVQGIFWAAMAVGNYQTVYLQSIGFPATDFGLLNAIACAVAIFAMTFWGTVSDRIGSVRKIVILTLTLGCGLFIFVPLIPTGQSYSTLLFLILIPIINFFRVPMSPFVDNLTVRNCAEHRLNYGMVRSSGSLLFAVAGVITVNALIPVIGNGDVTTPEKAEELVQTTGCDGIMIARGAQGNPWIFSEMIGKEKNGVTPPRPDKEAIRNMILRHSKLQIQYRGEFAGMREMRKHVAWYTKGLTGAADLRRRVNETETLDELMMLLEEL